jgi:ABC-type multidrug transport system ATPase subunit
MHMQNLMDEQQTVAIAVDNVRKSYDSEDVLCGVNLRLPVGVFYALMGPNGSGKSTLVSIIAGTSSPDGGAVKIFGINPGDDGIETKRFMGYVPQENFSSPHLTGRENLVFFARLFGLSKSEAEAETKRLLEMMELSDHAEKRVSDYSGGMRKKLEVATALLPGVRILVLDEPNTGLDPSARRDFLDFLKQINETGTTILLVTHIGEDAEAASLVGFMSGGKIILEDSPGKLKRASRLQNTIFIDIYPKSDRVAIALAALDDDCAVVETPDGFKMLCSHPEDIVHQVVLTLKKIGCAATRIEMVTPSLEDVFFAATRYTAEDEIVLPEIPLDSRMGVSM